VSVTDAYFEAMSAFTATGATVLTGLDALPLSVNVWRCFMMLIGGLGIIVLAVAILPLLGVGGSAAVQGRDRRPDEGRQAHAAHRRDGARPVGGVLRAVGGLLLAYRGGHELGRCLHAHVHDDGPGRLLVYDASFGYWNSPAIEAVAIVFMLLSGVSFALYFVAWKRRAAVVWQRRSARLLPGVWLATVALISIYLWCTASTRLPGIAAPHGLPRGVDRHHHRLRLVRLCAVAAVRAAADDPAGLLRHLRRLHRRRHQDGPHAAAAEAGAARAGAHRASERGEPGGAGRRGGGAPQ
jgi:trk system potassium uptake protein TrkH